MKASKELTIAISPRYKQFLKLQLIIFIIIDIVVIKWWLCLDGPYLPKFTSDNEVDSSNTHFFLLGFQFKVQFLLPL